MTTSDSLVGKLNNMSIRARVSQGRLVVDEPVDLPEGTVLDLVIDDEEDELDDEERRALHARLAESASPASLAAARPIAMVLAELRQNR
jgi:hypothetical protein